MEAHRRLPYSHQNCCSKFSTSYLFLTRLLLRTFCSMFNKPVIKELLCCCCAARSNVARTTRTTCLDASLVLRFTVQSSVWNVHWQNAAAQDALRHRSYQLSRENFINMHKVIHENLSRVTRPSLLSFVSPRPRPCPFTTAHYFVWEGKGWPARLCVCVCVKLDVVRLFGIYW